MRAALRFLTCLVLSCGSLVAQGPFNPYADAELIAITPDGKINWPTFYKSVATTAKYDVMFKNGNCRGNSHEIVSMLTDNKVNINQLPEEELVAKVVQVTPAGLVLSDKNQVLTSVMIHPKNVSKIEVQGEIPLKQLKAGMLVRLTAKVDEKGESAAPVPTIEVFSNQQDYPFAAIEPNERLSFAARVVRLRDETLELRVDTGKIRNLKVPVAKDTTVALNMDNLSLVTPGDQVEIRGHVYQGPGIKTKQAVFANKITVKKPALPEPVAPKRKAASSDLTSLN